MKEWDLSELKVVSIESGSFQIASELILSSEIVWMVYWLDLTELSSLKTGGFSSTTSLTVSSNDYNVIWIDLPKLNSVVIIHDAFSSATSLSFSSENPD